MIYIENQHFRAGITVSGAELRSLKNKSTGTELIWQADPAVWGSSAPILFPIVGTLLNGKTVIDGLEYAIPKHGVLRGRAAEVSEQGDDFVTFRFCSDNETLKKYPFPFEFLVTFRLKDNELAVDYCVINTGETEMLFSIGSHPAFALDLDNTTLSDYRIEFNRPETLDLYGLTAGMFSKKQDNYLSNETDIPLSENIFSDDALMFCNIQSDKISLKCNKQNGGLEMQTRGAPHLGIWSKPGAPFVCIEPWFSFDDAADSDGQFQNKPGIMPLLAGEKFETGYTVRVTD